MRIAEVVHGVPFEKVRKGNIIQFFDKDGNLYTGMKVASQQTEGILFLRSYPPYKPASIFFFVGETRPWDQDLMLEFPDALLVTKGFAKLPDGHAPHMGSLTIRHDGTTMLLSKTDGSALYVDMKTGDTSRPETGSPPPLSVSKWAIVVPNGEASESLVEFPESRPPLQ